MSTHGCILTFSEKEYTLYFVSRILFSSLHKSAKNFKRKICFLVSLLYTLAAATEVEEGSGGQAHSKILWEIMCSISSHKESSVPFRKKCNKHMESAKFTRRLLSKHGFELSTAWAIRIGERTLLCGKPLVDTWLRKRIVTCKSHHMLVRVDRERYPTY